MLNQHFAEIKYFVAGNIFPMNACDFTSDIEMHIHPQGYARATFIFLGNLYLGRHNFAFKITINDALNRKKYVLLTSSFRMTVMIFGVSFIHCRMPLS